MLNFINSFSIMPHSYNLIFKQYKEYLSTHPVCVMCKQNKINCNPQFSPKITRKILFFSLSITPKGKRALSGRMGQFGKLRYVLGGSVTPHYKDLYTHI